MEARRQDAIALKNEHKAGILPWFLKAGSGMLGFANGASSRWIWSVAGTVLLPIAMRFVHKGSDALLGRILDTILPSKRHSL